MTPARLFLLLLGAEIFPWRRIQPGRGVALLILASLSIKHALYQYLPIAPPHAMVLHIAAAITGLYIVVGLFGFARIRMLMIPKWNSGSKWLSFGASDKTTLLKIEPVIAFLLVGACIFAVSPGDWGRTAQSHSGNAWDRILLERSSVPVVKTTQGNVFRPFWHYGGFFVPRNALGQPVTVYGRHLPGWFHADALLYAGLLPFIAVAGFMLHGRHFDWPESSEYLAEQRQAHTAHNPGTLTFTTVEEVR